MKKYDHIMIGFGKGSKTLAGALASKGEKVAIVEKSEKMFGGTCINVACIPTKFLENQARISKQFGGSQKDKASRYKKAIQDKRELTARLREKNYQKGISQGVDVVVGEAAFVDDHQIQVTNQQESFALYGEHIYINTGAAPFIPEIEGLKASKYVYTSETMMELEELPKELVIIGGGYIGLEFASYYTNFGSKVTIIQDGNRFIPREDEEIAQVVYQSLTDRGVEILFETQILSIADEAGKTIVTIKNAQGKKELSAEAVLVATGRRPNIKSLKLENAGVEVTERGAVSVNEYLQTSVPHIWAMGDVVGGLQFTYISLDDSRIVKSQLLGDGSRSTKNRGEVPYTVFLDPPLSRVGLTEQQALDKGYAIKTAKLPVMAIPKAQVLQKPEGMMKVIVQQDTDLILGAHLFAVESYELINLIKLAMDQKIPYQVLRDSIYTHPTMSESFNDLLGMIP